MFSSEANSEASQRALLSSCCGFGSSSEPAFSFDLRFFLTKRRKKNVFLTSPGGLNDRQVISEPPCPVGDLTAGLCKPQLAMLEGKSFV